MSAVFWPDLIDSNLMENGLSVRKLAAELGVSHVFLGAVRKGTQPASPMLKLKLLERQGRDLSVDDLLLILPENVAEHWLHIQESRKANLVTSPQSD